MVCGDGDCGNSLANVSNVILSDIEQNKFNFIETWEKKGNKQPEGKFKSPLMKLTNFIV